MSRNAGGDENGDFGEISSVNLTIFIQITSTSTEMDLSVGEFDDFCDFYANYINRDRPDVLANLTILAIFMQITCWRI